MPGRGSLGYDYQPAESRDGLFGGNSNWRGPVWFPVNVLLLGALRAYERALAADTTFEYPVGTGRQRRLGEIIAALRDGLVDLFRVGRDGRRPGDPRTCRRVRCGGIPRSANTSTGIAAPD